MKRGITLMEVLISMFVLLIGLMGVFSMLPVAKSYMADSTKYDAVSTLGHAALHDLEVRHELMDPSNWFAPAANGQFMEVCPESTTIVYPAPIGPITYAGGYNYNWDNNSPIGTIPAAPFILDPLACAYPDNLVANGGIGSAALSGQLNTAGSYGPTFFPPSGFSLDGAGSPGSPALTRITVPVSRLPGYVIAGMTPASTTYQIDANGAGIRFCQPLPFASASKIFTSADDLLFNRSDDATARPFVSVPSASAPSQFSTSQGDYSWFAVIDNVQRPWNPGPDGGWGDATKDDNNDGTLNEVAESGFPTGDPLKEDVALWKTSGGELWHVWAVVVHKRNLQLIPKAAGEIPPERMCYCDFLTAPLPAPSTAQLSNAGLGGGDCVLSVPASLSTSPDWLNVKPNQWIMMSAWPNLASGATALSSPVRGQLPIVQWFRIQSAGEIIQTANGFQRPVTLVGPDWNPYKFVDAIGAPAGNQSCYCTIVDGAVGVFEGTIEQGQ